MSEKRECRPCEEKKLTRSQFLGVGAAAAATGLAGRVAPLHGAGSRPQPLECPPAEDDWAIPTSLLNILWADVWPRVTAQMWQTGVWFDPADMGENIVPLILGAIPSLVAASSSCEFNARASRLIPYLSRSLGDGRIPIRLIGRGHDFVLSDAGLDLFAPERPADVEMLRYYRFRRTGRGSLGLSNYLDTWPKVILTDSPTGPSQIAIDFNLAADIVVSSEAEGCVLGSIECVREFFGRTPRPTNQVGTERQDGDQVAPALDQDAQERQVTELDQVTYMCLVDECRCWQVSGAVYRGISTQLPRIVADIWYERAACYPGGTPPATSYDYRFHTLPPEHREGMRTVFEETLETTLPSPDDMLFRFHPSSPPLSGLWNADDVMITNRGFYLPPLPSSDPDLTTILSDIVAGNAGNPVFTDSRRSI